MLERMPQRPRCSTSGSCLDHATWHRRAAIGAAVASRLKPAVSCLLHQNQEAGRQRIIITVVCGTCSWASGSMFRVSMKAFLCSKAYGLERLSV